MVHDPHLCKELLLRASAAGGSFQATAAGAGHAAGARPVRAAIPREFCGSSRQNGDFYT